MARVDRQRVILEAAFAVFARRGFAEAGVQEVADEAGVAKPTVYNHFVDKETLFRQAVEAASETVLARNLAVLDAVREPGDDLRSALDHLSCGLVESCCDPTAVSLRWLAYAQSARFPDLLDAVHRTTAVRLAEVLADRFAHLVLAGRLRRCEPAVAAEQFLALLTGPVEARSRLGRREVSPEERLAVRTAAVDTFLRAYGV